MQNSYAFRLSNVRVFPHFVPTNRVACSLSRQRIKEFAKEERVFSTFTPNEKIQKGTSTNIPAPDQAKKLNPFRSFFAYIRALVHAFTLRLRQMI